MTFSDHVNKYPRTKDETDDILKLIEKISELNLELQLLKLKNLKSGDWTTPWRDVDMNV